MPIPDTFIVGAPRCGTTTMCDWLGQHPQVFMAARKELHHFGDVLNDPADKDRARYLAYFDAAGDAKRIGEASVWYLYSEPAAREIKAFNPNARVIIMLRNPIDLVRSLHQKLIMLGMEDEKDFRRALELEADRRRQATGPDGRVPLRPYFYREVGRLAGPVKTYLEIFGRERVRVIIHDDFSRDLAGVFRQTLEFLEVDPDFAPAFARKNENREVRSLLLHRALRRLPNWAYALRRKLLPADLHPGRALMNLNAPAKRPAELPPDLRAELARDFKPDVARLAELIGRDLGGWTQT